MNDADTAEEWEIRMAEGFKSVDAKTVTIEFEFNGKKASEKMEPKKIIQKMVSNDYFSGYDFEVSKRGEKLIKDLGASQYWDDKNTLRCRHIIKITYGKKILYSKK